MSTGLRLARSIVGKRGFVLTARAMGGGPNLPPFGRARPPTSKLPEEVELIWDDTVAPETTIDFDAPHVSTKEVLAMFFGAFAFFGTLYSVIALGDPVGSNPVALRSTVIPASTMQQVVGAEVSAAEGDDDDE